MSKKEEKNKKKKMKKKKHTVLKFFLCLFLVFALAIGGFVTYSTFKNGWGFQGIIQTAMGQDDTKLEDLDPITVLILGVSEDISSRLTDTIMIASYNPKTQRATLISIPRDTFVGNSKNTASSVDKINAIAQSKGGELKPEKTLDAVNKMTGLNIVYYVLISNNALVELVDTIGGVEFDVPIDMNYDDSSQNLAIHLKKGFQKLNGEQAEGLVRFRKNNNGTSYPSSYGDNDLGRMKTQREFLKEVAKQTLKVKNITKLGSFADILKKNVTTNISNWTVLKDYLPYAIEFNTENIENASIPGNPSSFGPYSLSFFEYDKKKTLALVNELMEKQNETNEEEVDSENEIVTPSKTDNTVKTNTTNTTKTTTETSKSLNIKIELLNGSGDTKVLTEVTDKLKKKGYNVYKTGTTTITNKTTIINKKSISDDSMNDLKSILGTGIVSNSTSSTSNVDVTIVIGKDYK